MIMVEKTILDYLSGVLDVPAYMERPPAEPKSYVLIEKTGSSTENYIESATLAIQSYAASMCDAAALNCRVKAAMNDSVQLPEISRCDCNSDYNYTDTTKKKYRYQAVFDIVYLGGE